MKSNQANNNVMANGERQSAKYQQSKQCENRRRENSEASQYLAGKRKQWPINSHRASIIEITIEETIMKRKKTNEIMKMTKKGSEANRKKKRKKAKRKKIIRSGEKWQSADGMAENRHRRQQCRAIAISIEMKASSGDWHRKLYHSSLRHPAPSSGVSKKLIRAGADRAGYLQQWLRHGVQT